MGTAEGGGSKGGGGDSDKASSSKTSSSKPRSHAPKAKSAPKPSVAKTWTEAGHDADDEADSAMEADEAAAGEGGVVIKSKSSGSKSHRSKEANLGEDGDGADQNESKESGGAPPVSAKKRKPKFHDDDEDKNGEGEGPASTPRYQSNRAAALVAKTKLNSRAPKSPVDEEVFNQTLPASSSKAKTAAEQAALQWACCDRCGKWRSLPSHVQMDSLPEQWYCSMNLWDDRFNDCSIEEEVVDDADESVDLDEDDDTDRMGGSDVESSSHRKGFFRPGSSPRGSSSALEKVNWVQCNKCTKWRKVPGVIDVDSLPDVWQCSMNTWAPAFARCGAKEETDDPEHAHGQSGLMRGKRPSGIFNGGAGAISFASGPAVKKVIQWVQCERRNCKKWRKLPGHVDMTLLPEKWYCEMNEWDLERASCEAPEYSDSDGETTRASGETRSHPMLANPKSGGTLSYRRIIFGTDGRIRPNYNEKNKTGFGLFSFTDSSRLNGDDQEEETVVVEPTRRISYWWSSAYDESGSNFVTSQSQHPSSAGSYSSQIKREPSRETVSDVVEEAESKAIQIAKLARDQPVHHLVRAARKLGGIETLQGSVYPLKRLKHERLGDNRTLIEIELAECAVVRSCLQSSSTLMLPLSTLMETIRLSYFHSRELEACRSKFTVESVAATIQRMEAIGEVDVTFKRNGELIVQSNPLPPQQLEGQGANTMDFWKRQAAPLKLRKFIQREQRKEFSRRESDQNPVSGSPTPP